MNRMVRIDLLLIILFILSKIVRGALPGADPL
jgi:hypothetical protein